MTTALHRPAPLDPSRARPLDSAITADVAAAALERSETLLLQGRYGFGLDVLERLRVRLAPPGQQAPHAQREAFERRYREAGSGLLVPVRGQRVDLPGSPPVGFLRELYREGGSFALPLLEIEDLANAWRRYHEGVHLAVLGQRVYPFYGTYAPTRTEHLELFATWLQRWEGARGVAVDVGTGCGVIALLLARAGFASVRATDINPNAIESVRRELRRHPSPPPVEATLGDLLDPVEPGADLIAFNPPWTEGRVKRPLDTALVYEPGLFERFFAQARTRLAAGGRLVLLFSTIQQLVQPDRPHPIEDELARGHFVLVEKHQRRIRPPRDAQGQRRRTRERVEVWVLAGAEDPDRIPDAPG